MPMDKYYALNKDKVRQKQKEYYQLNKETIGKRTNKYAKKYLSENFEKKLYWSSMHTAKKRSLEFNISVEDIVIPELCPYLNVPLTTIMGQGIVETNASIDRIDSSEGYIKGNIQIISYLANKMKQNASIETLIKFAEGVLKTHAGRAIDNQTSSET